eukprot:scaffold106102_cov10-Tisochrysis_lutea.AAC.1
MVFLSTILHIKPPVCLPGCWPVSSRTSPAQPSLPSFLTTDAQRWRHRKGSQKGPCPTCSHFRLIDQSQAGAARA